MSWQIKNSHYGTKAVRLPIDYDPMVYPTIEDAASAFHMALKDVAQHYGYNASDEVLLVTPEESAEQGLPSTWVVMWHSGPFEWANVSSQEFMFNNNAGWYTLPFTGSCLCFFGNSVG